MKKLGPILTLPLLAAALAPAASARAQELPPKVEKRRTPLVQMIERVQNAVVSIDCSVKRGPFSFFKQPVSGTGVVIFEDGVIVTNYHVVAPNGSEAKDIVVRFADGSTFPGRIISRVQPEDLALVKIDGDEPFPTIEMSDYEPMLGESVIAIGNALGQTHTVSTGIVSGLHRDLDVSDDLHFKSLLQTDAAINPGNSGGPLLDVNGELIGINTAIRREAENIGFAIPVARVRTVLAKMLNPAQADSYLGYAIDENTFVVSDVIDTGPAQSAGLLAGDRVVSIDGNEIKDAASYSIARLSIEPGKSVRLVVDRDGRELAVEVEPWDMVGGWIHRKLGITVREIPIGRYSTYYLELTSVDPAGPAGRIGLQRGDIIAAVQPASYSRGRKIQRARDLAWLTFNMEPNSAMRIEVWRDDDKDGRLERSEESSELYSGTLRIR